MDRVKKFKNSGSYSRRLQKNIRLMRDSNLTKSIYPVPLPIENGNNVLATLIPSPLLAANTLDSVTSTHKEICINNIFEGSGKPNSSSDSDDEFISNLSKNEKSKADIRNWANLHNITQMALKDLLEILNNNFDANLPKDPRTLMQTPTTITVQSFENGQYWHHGLTQCLTKYFQNLTSEIHVNININIDGLPIYKSSKIEFWPILFNIHNMKEFKPMIIGLYCGNRKPNSIESFLTPFVEEIKPILENGVIIHQGKVTVGIRSFICDSPARAFVKGKQSLSLTRSIMNLLASRAVLDREYDYIDHTN